MADQEGARKSDEFIAVSLTPDVCKTPVGSTLVPVPYMIVADLSDSFATSPNVRFGGQPVFVHDQSKISHVTGDEAGIGGGIVSGTYKGIVESVEGSSTVRVNGKPVVRHGDPCKMNNGNTIGRILYQGPGGGAPNTSGDTNPPVVPETPEEEQAAREKRGLWARLSEDVHTGLDVIGFIPGVGIFADLANAGIYAAEGNWAMAGISAVAAAPGIGDGIKAGAMVAKAGGKVAREAAERGAKEAAEKGTKKAGEKIGKDGVRVEGRRSKKARDSSKAEKHGDSGRRLGKAERQIKERKEQLKNAKGREAKRIKKRIQNTRRAAQRAKKGETHHRR
ncbi:PAAR-like domain-containing protein [Candidatus Thiosymbion oneisti]|uniref:PAAR-like domain-containing protein n=1 Tax=Candidatus Thiosymbion oneisti TaxID=589554 RepID=UPI000A5B2447|nr:PAAR-like domain-containing protein [Candidatus Thiosymbion oneisti]